MQGTTQSNCKIDIFGNMCWYLDGKKHKEDGPAVEYASGTKEWWVNGKRHREDGPAVEKTNGDKYWFQNGEFHRTDGPAIECLDGYKGWYIHGTHYVDIDSYCEAAKILGLEKYSFC